MVVCVCSVVAVNKRQNDRERRNTYFLVSDHRGGMPARIRARGALPAWWRLRQPVAVSQTPCAVTCPLWSNLTLAFACQVSPCFVKPTNNDYV